MKFTRTELSPNVYLNYAYSERFKTEGLTLYFLLPLQKETLSADSLLPEVLRMGCASTPTPRLMARRMQEAYDTSIAVSQYNIGYDKAIVFSADMLSPEFLPNKLDTLTAASDFLSDIICRPYKENALLSDKHLALRQKALIEAVRAEINHKGTYALLRCRAAMTEGTVTALLPYGTEEMLNAVTPKALTENYHRLLTDAAVECFYEGRAPIDEVQGKLAFLKDFGKNYNARCAPDALPEKKSADIRYIEERVAARQGRLVIGLRYSPCKTREEHAAFAVMLEILAYSPIAKLFVRVREAMGLCYSCSAVNDFTRGLLFLTAGIDNDKSKKVENAMLAQIRQIGRRRFTDNECEAAKKSLTASLAALSDTPDSLELFMLRRRRMGIPTTPEEEITRIEAVSASEIAAAARKLSPDTVYFLYAEPSEDGGDADDE